MEVCTAEAVSDTVLIQLRRAFKEKQSGESKTRLTERCAKAPALGDRLSALA